MTDNENIINTPLKRIAAVHDISGVGKCSLTVALPVISAAGVECSCIPTALLSTHTGEFENFTFHDLSSEMEPIARHWRDEGIIFDGIYSGYLASPHQEKLLERVIEYLSDDNTLIIVDPVMADHGKYYSGFDDSMCRSFKRLCGRASIITPNITEAALMTGLPYRQSGHDREYIHALLKGLEALGPKTIALTGVHLTPGKVGVAARDCISGQEYFSERTTQQGVFYGTGDLLTSALAALLVRGARLQDALDAAVSLVSDSIERTVLRNTPRRFGVDFEGAIPAFIQAASKLSLI